MNRHIFETLDMLEQELASETMILQINDIESPVVRPPLYRHQTIRSLFLHHNMIHLSCINTVASEYTALGYFKELNAIMYNLHIWISKGIPIEDAVNRFYYDDRERLYDWERKNIHPSGSFIERYTRVFREKLHG